MRGFKSKNSGSAFTDMRRIVYNFVRTHQGLGKTPADEAGLKMPLDNNRLLNLISLSNSPLALPYSVPYVVEDAVKNPMCYGF
jgi:hypothetical protein